MEESSQATGSGFKSADSIAGRVGNYFLHHRVQTGSGVSSVSYPMGYGSYVPRDNVRQTTHLQLMLRLRMHGTSPLFCMLRH
jgi:hypothetical protein